MRKLARTLGFWLLASAHPLSGQNSPDATCVPKVAVNVFTHHNSEQRTGANLHENCLTPASVTSKTFGRLFSLTVVGQIYAQPLIVTGLTIGGQTRNVLYVATMENHVYAFDADGHESQPLWEKYLGAPLPVSRIPKDIGAALGQFNIEPVVGITSTPVIDPKRGWIYVVAKIAEPNVACPGIAASTQCPVFYKIFALDLVKGDIQKTTQIDLPAPDPQKDPCFFDQTIPNSMDAARINLQRPALLLNRDRIYLGFGSHQDAPCPNYHGRLISFDAGSLEQLSTFVVTTGKKGGIWQAGNGPAADQEGNVWVLTGNGDFVKDQQFSGNFVKLSPDLSKKEWFAPPDVERLNDDYWDIDLGASGPVVLPGANHQIVGGGKQGRLYLVDTVKPGGQQKGGFFHDYTNPPIQFFWAAHRWSLALYSWIPGAMATGYHHIHGAPVFWGDAAPQDPLKNGILYVWPERDYLKAFTYQNGQFVTSPVAKGQKAGQGMPGGMLSVSADGPQNGIVWAAIPLRDDAWIHIVRGSLRAFQAQPVGNKLKTLWTSYCAEPEDSFNFAKYVPPTVANGKVYLATFSNRVNVYGLYTAEQSAAARDLNPDCKPTGLSMGPNYRKTNQAEKVPRH